MAYAFRIMRQHLEGSRPKVWYEDTADGDTIIDALDEVKELVRTLSFPNTVTSIVITHVPGNPLPSARIVK